MARLELNEICWPDGDAGVIARGVVDEYTVDYFKRTLALAVSTAPRNLIIDVSECELVRELLQQQCALRELAIAVGEMRAPDVRYS
jgi:hypothetical protein